MLNVKPQERRWNVHVSLGARVPIVLARRVSTRDNDLLVITCPYCGDEHSHGACGRGSAFGAGDGHREAHCVKGSPNPGYILREVAA